MTFAQIFPGSRTLLVAGLWCCAVAMNGAGILPSTTSQAAAAPPNTADYLKIIRAFADTMIEHGRDVYGEEHSPLFAATLDRDTLRLPEGEKLDQLRAIPFEDWGVRPYDRTLTGANPMQHQDFYQVLYGLTEVTGEPRYAAAADEALGWFFRHCQSPATGLMAWGEHMGWDFLTEKPLQDKYAKIRDIHEYARPWLLWDRCYRLAPDRCHRFALGVWNHQIHDQKTGGFSRHAGYSRHNTAPIPEFPRHGGFYIGTWAAAYQYTEDPRMLLAIETLVNKYNASRNKQTDAVPPSSNQTNNYQPATSLSLAIDLGYGAERVPEETAKIMRDCAARTDKVFLQTARDVGPGGKGFATRAKGTDLARTVFSENWATAYGMMNTNARFALMCLERHAQTKNETYQRLAVEAGKRYLKSDPDKSTVIWPGTMGEVILLMTRLYRQTGDEAFLRRADHFATMAVGMFFDGDSTLPRASSHHDHYEAITLADTLAMSLLELWATHKDRDPMPRLVWGNR